MTTLTEREQIIRRIELRKQMGRRIPHKLLVKLQDVTEKELATVRKVGERDWLRVN